MNIELHTHKVPWISNAGFPSLGFDILSTTTKVAPFCIYPVQATLKDSYIDSEQSEMTRL